MSTAVIEPAVGKHKAEQSTELIVIAAGTALASSEKGLPDPHPLLPVFVSGAFALILAITFVGSIIAWLALRNSGIMFQ